MSQKFFEEACEIYERYLNDPVFHRLTDWMIKHIMTETFNYKDFTDAAKMAASMADVAQREGDVIDYGCLENILKEGDGA